MIRRLRRKFVLMNMVFVTVLLAAVFVVVVQTTRSNLAEASLWAMEQAALEPPRPGRPGQRPEERSIPCFLLRLGPHGELLASGDGYFDLTDEAWLRTILEAAMEAGGQEGVLDGYRLRYRLSGPPEHPTLIFADMAGEIQAMKALARTCLLAAGAAFLGFLAVSILLSRWAVAPVERAWEQQRQFVADASHELKTPLAVILTNAELLQDGPADDASQARFTGNILTTARRMRRLVENLLELARVEAAPEVMGAVSLSGLLQEALLPFEPVFFEEGLTLTGDISENIEVRGIESQLRQVADILLDNARKYSAPGSEVLLRLRPAGRNCLLTVSSPGEPLTEQERRDVFKRFYRAGSSGGREDSCGLGLAIAQGVVIRHGGKIWAESGEAGNTFCIRLPLLRQAAGRMFY